MEAAVNQTKVPLIVNGINKVNHCVESRHAGLSKGKVDLQRRKLQLKMSLRKHLERLSFPLQVTNFTTTSRVSNGDFSHYADILCLNVYVYHILAFFFNLNIHTFIKI